ncbi:MAG: vitamin B12 dependent-methionine synthase activation domain-containing protein [Oscillospiraceae bacterium]|nr:vitamin B12 dependent-methionine synthase activation domain-containing protein [Oscillospiraceae bacterium]
MVAEKPDQLNREDVYRYLGCSVNQIDDTLRDVVSRCSREILYIAQPRVHWIEVPLKRDNGTLQIQNTSLVLEGKDIAAHLQGCESCILSAVTLGAQIDAAIRAKEADNMLTALVWDSCASVLIEQIAQQIWEQIRENKTVEKQYITGRFSPGYGDLPLELQGKLVSLLDTARKIGLTATADNILIPKKSITAIIGVARQPVVGKLAGCEHCAIQKICKYRKEGKTCVQ